MSNTPYFNLKKVAGTDPYDIADFNGNMDTIDTEMHRPPLTVNETEPDENRNITITTVPLADNLTSDEAQINSGTYTERTSGGEASIEDGSAWLSDIRGNMVKTGYIPESIQMTAAEGLEVTLDRDTFVAYVQSSQTITLTYTTDWSADPELYGLTIEGEPQNGDQIVIVYVKENRGLITVATPSTFVSTGWNLYNHAAGYAKVVNYSEEYGFMIAGTYTSIAFAETVSGEQTPITPVDGYFTVPSDGFVFVTGGNTTDTEIWMTWSDWTDEANGGVFEAYTQDTIDLSGVMVDFPDGLMRVGNAFDEINLNTSRAYRRVEKLEYTQENLDMVIASGVQYDTDTNYIYAARVAPITYTISLDGEYTVSDHGMELFTGTSVAVTASSLYGNDLKGKLRRDVLTISQQTLTTAQKEQVYENLGLDELNNNFIWQEVYSDSLAQGATGTFQSVANYNELLITGICTSGGYDRTLSVTIRPVDISSTTMLLYAGGSSGSSAGSTLIVFELTTTSIKPLSVTFGGATFSGSVNIKVYGR